MDSESGSVMKRTIIPFIFTYCLCCFCMLSAAQGRSQFIRYNLASQNFSDSDLLSWLAEQPEHHSPLILKFNDNLLTEEAVRSLGSSTIGVTHSISFSGNPIGDSGAYYLASAKMFATTEILYLAGTGVTEEGVKHLLGNETLLSSLRILDLSGNKLGDEGLAVLAKSAVTKNITHLYLDDTGCSDQGAIYLASAENFGSLEYLSLSGNQLSVEGRKALETSTSFANEIEIFIEDEG